jgi:hypothetical protein
MQPIPNEIPILINGSVYGWTSLRIQFSNMSLPLIGVTNIQYSATREFENVYAAGDQPVARSSGNVTYEASITLFKDEVMLLQKAAPQGDITLLSPFEIIVSYRSDILDKITTETLKNVQFTSNPTSVAQNDKVISVELPLIISGIKRGDAVI